MTPQQYCQTQIIPGSSLHYSLRFLPLAQRQPLTILHAWSRELHTIVKECSQIEIAYAKFQWWHGEMAQLWTGGPPSHPVTQALQPFISIYHWSAVDFEPIIAGLLWHLTTTRYTTGQELIEVCQQTGGQFSRLCAQIMGYQQEETLKYAEQLGIALELTHRLRHLREDIRRGYWSIPQEDLARFNLTESSVLHQPDSSAEMTRTLLAYQATRIRTYFDQALKQLPKKDRFKQRGGLIRAQLALTTLQEIEADGYQLFRHYVTLPPLRKWWITWKTLILHR